MGRDARYFDLSLDSLRILGGWAADCAQRALPIFEGYEKQDARPREAIEGIRVFAAGGRRTALLRRLSLAALAAAREASSPAAAAAAWSASLAAASAYTHPLADVQQTKHILGPAAYAALAIELDRGDDAQVLEAELRWAIEGVRPEVRDILIQMPAREEGRTRLEALLHILDVGVRGRRFGPET
jgi:hypothetical protein